MSPASPAPAGADAGPSALDAVTARASVVVCCGAGGVGKTTTAATIALHAAEQGRRACVVTVDPARRLADALGLDRLSNEPTAVEGPWPGSLNAMMLDPKRTFDDLVTRYADSPEQAQGILANRIYRNLTGALSGTQEYMAMEKLYELVEEHDFDVVVVDTPPSRNALDFLDAPRRLTNFLGNRLFQVLMMPTRTSLRMMGVAAQALLRTLSKVAGADVVRDAVTFFQAFEGMEEGFRHRAARMRELLTEAGTVFVVVASPRSESIEEAVHFTGKLTEAGMGVDALVVNRTLPRFLGAEDLADLERLSAGGPGSDGADRVGGGAPSAGTTAPARSPNALGALGALGALVRTVEGYAAAGAREDDALDELVAAVAPAPVVRVPLLAGDVHDVAGLAELGSLLYTAANEGGRPAR